MSVKTTERNQNIDIIRGIAILLVVLGHTITGSSIHYENTFLYNFIWAIQMPLFMIISGYVTRYSKEINSIEALGSYLKKRTISYLWPFTVWTFVIRAVIFGGTSYFNIKKFIYNLDSGYWFFFSLWTIVVIFGVSQFFANTIKKFNTTFGKAVKLFGFYILGAAALVVIGFFMGFSFLCIKLTLYYMPFFFLGCLYGTFEEQIQKLKHSAVITETVIMLSLGIFVLLLNKFSIYNIGEGIIGIAIRILASTTGCIAICGICSHTKDLFAKWRGTIQHIGAHTLEIYLVHYLVLSLFKQNYPLMSARGILSVVFNFTVTLTLSLIATKILNFNSVMKKILLGKMK